MVDQISDGCHFDRRHAPQFRRRETDEGVDVAAERLANVGAQDLADCPAFGVHPAYDFVEDPTTGDGVVFATVEVTLAMAGKRGLRRM